MQIIHNNMIPGLFTKGFEFFGIEKGIVKTFHDQQILSFNELPATAYEIIKKVMKKTDASLKEMEDFVFHRWGGLDGTPDIDENGNVSAFEYVPEFTAAYYDNGKEISAGQLRVLKLIELEDKVIADRLFMSHFTVARHCAAMYLASGKKNRTQLALWAKNKGII